MTNTRTVFNTTTRALLLIEVVGVFLMPFLALAHGGFEKRAGDTVVYITQSPISPLVGEQVTINLVLQNYNSFQRLTNTDVQIKVIDTFYGDESKDKIIQTTNYKTDVNGSLKFAYTFPKEHYFDIDISFTNPQTGKSEETGFLIQPRTPSSSGGLPILWAGIGIVAGLGGGILMKHKARKT